VRAKPTLARVMKLNAAAADFVEPLFEELAALPPPKRALRVNVSAARAYGESVRRLGLEECASQYVYPGR